MRILMWVQSLRCPKGNLYSKTHHTMYKSLRLVHSSSLYPTPEILCFTMLFNLADTPKVPLPVRRLYPHEIHVPWSHLTQQPKLHLDWFSHFCAAHGSVPILHNVC